MNKIKKILIGEISSYKALVIVKYLRKKYENIYIAGFDYHLGIKSFHSKYIDSFFQLSSKPSDSEDFLFELSSYVNNNDIDVFVPVHSESLKLILKNRGLFGQTLDYLGDYEIFNRLNNKDELMRIALKLNLRIPKNYESWSTAAVPFVAKPNNLSSSKGVKYFLYNKGTKLLHFGTNYIFQEFIKGVGCGFSVYARDGVILKSYGHYRLAEYPVTGGSSVYRKKFVHSGMKRIAEKILAETCWTGFAMFEFKHCSNDEVVLIEVNPRIWGSINQGLQNGVDFFEPILGYSPNNHVINKAVNTYLSPQIYLSLLGYLMKFNIKPFIMFIRNIRKNRVDVSILDDFSGWLSMILRKIL